MRKTEKYFFLNHGVWQALLSFENAITFLFYNRIQNGLRRSEGLIFLDLMEFLKNKVQKWLVVSKNSLNRRKFFKFFWVKNQNTGFEFKKIIFL